MRAYAYIDGFNLYYAVRNCSCKWLNLKCLLQQQLSPSQYAITKIKYYTARVSGIDDPGQPRRQQVYLDALATISELEIYYGNFLASNVWRPLVNLPVAGRMINSPPTPITLPLGLHAIDGVRPEILPVGEYPSSRTTPRPRRISYPVSSAIKVEILKREEKGSDVNLACHLINDAWKDLFDVAAIVSNDTDLAEPIRLVVQEKHKDVVVMSPNKFGVAPALKAVATHHRHLRPTHFRRALFGDPVSGTSIKKPTAW